MPIYNLKKLNQEIKNIKSIKPIYFFYGEEAFLINEVIKKIKNIIINDATKDFNYDIFYADNSLDFTKVFEITKQYPLMASKRIVIIKEFHQVKTKNQEKILDLIKNPIDTTVLIITAENINKKTKTYNMLKEQSICVEFKLLYDNQLVEWIKYICKNHQLDITKEAIFLLKQTVGNKLIDINNEIQKLQQFLLHKKSIIEPEDIEEVVNKHRINNIFELTNNLGNQNIKKSLELLNSLINQGENPIAILTLISRHFRILMNIKQKIKDGLADNELSKKVDIPHFFLNNYLDQIHLWETTKLEQIYTYLVQADQSLKSTSINQQIILENLIIKSCQNFKTKSFL